MADRSFQIPADADIQGRVEHLDDGVISGWMAIMGSNAPPTIEIVGPAGFYVLSCANIYRADLDLAGKSNGLCAFSVMTGAHHHHEIADFAVLPAGLPHRLRGPGDESIHPIQSWLDTAQDPLAQDLIVHRCHLACNGIPASPSLLAAARPAFPLDTTSLYATMVQVLEYAKRPQPDQPDQITATIHNVYRGLLRREADLPTVERHRQALLSGTSLAQLIEEVADMPEFLQSRDLSRGTSHSVADGVVPELHRVSDSIEKALLTLAVAAGREKPPLAALPKSAEHVGPVAGSNARPKSAASKRAVLARGHPGRSNTAAQWPRLHDGN